MGQQTGEPINLDIAPGFYTEKTPTTSMGRWIDGDLVRFKNGLPQSMGGWKNQPLSSSLIGVPRSLHDWVALDQTDYIAVGTEKRLYIIEGDLTVTNITPIREQGQLTNPFFTSTTGAYDPNATGVASFFQVQDTNHGCSVGDIVTFANFTSPVGGIDVNGDFEVISVTDVNNYVVQGATDATATVNGGGGTGDYIYEISVGTGASATQAGWGTGGWGQEAWNTPRTTSTFVLALRTWSLDNWGEDLMASPRGGEIYYWDKTLGLGQRAVEIAEAPDTNLRVMVSPENRQLISFGADNGISADPLFIRWTDNEDFTAWTPATDNTAGNKRIDEGSELITAVKTRVGILFFTDTSVHVMQPTGGIQIYSFRQVGESISIAGPSAAVSANGVVYFMGKTNFYIYDGTLRVMPCEVWTKIFDAEKSQDSLNNLQSFSVFCSHNKNFNEIWWFYPSQGQSVNDRYVIYNYLENVWYYGALERASFHDFSPFADSPYGFDNEGNFYSHEDGVDDDVNPMNSYIISSAMSITDGDEIMHVSKLIPDFDRISGSVSVDLIGKKWPQKTTYTKGPYNATGATDEMGVRIRARFLAIRITQNGLGESFRMGPWRARWRPDGER